MRALTIAPVTDATLAASNVAENDYAAWLVGTTYAANARVIVLSNHSIYQSVAGGNVGNDPSDAANVVSSSNPTGAWVYVSPTNRWRAFDGSNSQKTTNASSITYTIDTVRTSNTLALLGLEAISVRVRVLDSSSTVTYDVTKDLLDTTTITTFFGYFTFSPEDYASNALFAGLPAYPASTIEITIDGGGGTAAVSVIGWGNEKIIGTTLVGTTPSIIDYSTKETDAFGATNIVQRGFAKTVEFNVAFPTSQYLSISRYLEPLRSAPAIYYEDEDLEHDLIVLGFYTDFSPALAINQTMATIEITGVI